MPEKNKIKNPHAKRVNVHGADGRRGAKDRCRVKDRREAKNRRGVKDGYEANIARKPNGGYGTKFGYELNTARRMDTYYGKSAELYEKTRDSLPPITENTGLPELLVPCGSEEAVHAAAESGADAVYCGGKILNARMNAKNFDDDALKRTVTYCRRVGVKVYVTLNTLVFDRELRKAAEYAKMLYDIGVDALIVADAGLCMLLREYLPVLELHASTQLSAHNLAATEVLGALGFSRVVLAREMNLADIRYICENSSIETEIFVHGALCVSRSGQCLMSSVVGGRSGNRGECAQPCRLPYNGNYPLSLKDLCLAGHITDLISCGLSCLKIEGRMKSPSYISGVTAIYRRLLDERRNASSAELEKLKNIFSRSGFTDGYFTGVIGNQMLGVRSEHDKAESRHAQTESHVHTTEDLHVQNDSIHAYTEDRHIQTESIHANAEYRCMQIESSQAYIEDRHTRTCSNQMRSENNTIQEKNVLAASILTSGILSFSDIISDTAELDETQAIKRLSAPFPKQERRKTARFLFAEQIPEFADEYFDVIALPPDEFVRCAGKRKSLANAVVFPSVIHDSELKTAKKLLDTANCLGAEYAYVGNLGHINLAREIGFTLLGDFRLNVVNSASPILYGHLGDFKEYILSPELILPQARDIHAVKSMIVYGRLPLMILEKSCGSDRLTDRKGAVFPVFKEMNTSGIRSREIVYNSCPVWMADRQKELGAAGIKSYHFVFSDETRREAASVIEAYRDKKAPPTGKTIKRIQKK